MKKGAAAAGSLAFFALAPCTVAGIVPWLLTDWQIRPMRGLLFAGLLRVTGAVLVVAGGLVLIHAFARFVLEGRGTPAPPAPTETLVVGGLYRHVRNPMYVAVVATIVGQGLVLGQPVLLLYAAAVTALFVAFVRLVEEPSLRGRFGAEYEAYWRAVPGWWPRLRRWHPDAAAEPAAGEAAGDDSRPP